ncbi:unnamed protein product [Hydatigera taeniaeformis]|uniref:Uncharacterized protein n=1 Tax=Hydatigena taeniaeformis TaxID=6205 RepID=A0A0R3WXA0_HYDTA|nr:unnamed protein product [Hydatigera taeniaeformis]
MPKGKGKGGSGGGGSGSGAKATAAASGSGSKKGDAAEGTSKASSKGGNSVKVSRWSRSTLVLLVISSHFFINYPVSSICVLQEVKRSDLG